MGTLADGTYHKHVIIYIYILKKFSQNTDVSETICLRGHLYVNLQTWEKRNKIFLRDAYYFNGEWIMHTLLQKLLIFFVT